MQIKEFYDKKTATLTYIVYDDKSKDAVIIDPVLDFIKEGATIISSSIAIYTDFIDSKKLNLHYILETHAHADHLSSAQYLKKAYPKALTVIGENIYKVQDVFKGALNFTDEFKADGSQFDTLVADKQIINVGTFDIEVISTPGHTPACTTFRIGNNLFVGDTIFASELGTARCDFPLGDAQTLYDSIQILYSYPDDTVVYFCHDYPEGREIIYQSTIKEAKENNISLNKNTTKEEFVKVRNARDASIAVPTLLFESVQFNIRAGALNPAEDNGTTYFKSPVTVK